MLEANSRRGCVLLPAPAPTLAAPQQLISLDTACEGIATPPRCAFIIHSRRHEYGRGALSVTGRAGRETPRTGHHIECNRWPSFAPTVNTRREYAKEGNAARDGALRGPITLRGLYAYISAVIHSMAHAKFGIGLSRHCTVYARRYIYSTTLSQEIPALVITGIATWQLTRSVTGVAT